MLKATVYNKLGEALKEIDLDPEIFGIEIKPELVHQAVVIQQANSRQVLASTKDKSEVSGGEKALETKRHWTGKTWINSFTSLERRRYNFRSNR